MPSFQLFGFQINRKPKPTHSVISPSVDDGSLVVSSNAGYYGTVIDLDGAIRNENDLIRRYRSAAEYADCDTAIEEIVNEAIVACSDTDGVKVILDDIKISDNIKNKIYEEFKTVLSLYEFHTKGHDLFRQWYIDGRLFFHIIIDPAKTTDGIQELRVVDPRKIRKIKHIKKEKNDQGIEINTTVDEYYLYNDAGISEQTKQGVKISLDSIIDCNSGLIDANTNMILGYLAKAVKPVNQLKMMEDALVIYRISRAPERRIFYIDIGNLPKSSADQYLTDIMQKFRNKIVYDAQTGEVQNSKQHMSMMEDFWIPRREGKSTEITTLPGGQNLDQIADIQYFQQKLWQALNVPMSRLQPNQNFSLGRTTEITREEIKFNKLIERLRNKFSLIFKSALGVQLISKGIVRIDEWDNFSNLIRFNFPQDNHFTELKQAELITSRVGVLQNLDPFVGKYYSVDWVRKNVLMQTEEEIKEMEKQIVDDINKYGQPESAQQQPQ